MITGPNCLGSAETIEKYSLQVLPDDQVAAFEEHLLVCEKCQAGLAAEDTFGDAMRHAALQLCRELPEGKRPFALVPRLIAVLACAATVLFLASNRSWIRPRTFAPAFVVKLEALRGSQPGSKAPAGRPLALQADVADLPAAASYRLELVDRDGRGVWEGATAGATVAGLRPGIYFLRVYSNRGVLLREYGLEVEAPSSSER